MRVEDIRVGTEYMWGGVRVRAVQTCLEGKSVHIRAEGIVDTWKRASDLRSTLPSEYLEDMRANYVQRFVPDSTDPLDTPEGQQFAEGHLGVVAERPAPVVFMRWEDVPCGSLTVDGVGDITHKRTTGCWGWWFCYEDSYDATTVYPAEDTSGVGTSSATCSPVMSSGTLATKVQGWVPSSLRGKR